MVDTQNYEFQKNFIEKNHLSSHRSKPSRIIQVLGHLQRSHFEKAARIIRENMEFEISQKHIARGVHETEWRVFIDGYWYSTRALLFNAFSADEMPYYGKLSDYEYSRYRAHLETLGFQVDRKRLPTHARVTSCSVSNLRLVESDPLDDELETLSKRNDLSTEARREIIARIGQGKFRAALIQLHGGCSVTGIKTLEVLRAAHIHRWIDCAETPCARLDLNNGLLLTANLDALFEVGLIAFDDKGSILISPRLNADAQVALGIHVGMRLVSTPSTEQRVYLAKHRDRTRAMRDEKLA